MHPYPHVRHAEEKRHDLMRTAERHRLLRSAFTATENDVSANTRAWPASKLAPWLARQLRALAERLEPEGPEAATGVRGALDC